ncbi:MAG: carboxylating nicotinate-nucleotide diphosphorylase [Endomicrobiales bacterium]|nr:carboxylating nicotinate-nucleotide diphosphorylase [Endomicrobiales bacterium]
MNKELLNITIKTIIAALKEDAAFSDITTLSVVPARKIVGASLLAKTACVVCGCDVFAQTILELDPKAKFQFLIPDGKLAKAGEVILKLTASVRSILSAERTALNFIQHLSGVATLTASYVNAIKGSGTIILDTRKTIPGLRLLEKYAVRCGGAQNHRMDLAQMAMLKDNHIELSGNTNGAGEGISTAIAKIRKRKPKIQIEVECETHLQVLAAIKSKADVIMLDNMNIKMLKTAIKTIKVLGKTNRPKIEISGGVSLKTVRNLAALGPDFISVGALTHSAAAADISLEIECKK